MSQPRHIYASTRSRRRPLWPLALGVVALVGAVLVLVLSAVV